MAGNAKENDSNASKNRMKEKYDVSNDLLGNGAFSDVYAATKRGTKESLAVKVINKSQFPPEAKSLLFNEIKILRTLEKLNHPNIIALHDIYSNNDNYYIFMERMATDLYEEVIDSMMTSIEPRLTRFLIKQILVTVQFLHDQDIVHCDIKPENILLDYRLEDNSLPLAKLADFGYARVIGVLDARQSFKGTFGFTAPEVLAEKDHDRSLDVWSIGVMTCFLLTGHKMFVGQTREDVEKDINKKLDSGHWPCSHLNPQAADFIRSCVHRGLERRTSIKDALNNKWLKKILLFKDIMKLEKRIKSNHLLTDDERRLLKNHIKNKRAKK